MKIKYSLIFIILVLLKGCATYSPKPLNKSSNLIKDITVLNIKKASLPGVEVEEVDISDGLTMPELDIVTLVNNPDLKLSRAHLGIAKAQAFAAGLLPDPQLGWSRDYPLTKQFGNVPAYNIGISYDLNSIIAYKTNKDSAKKELEKVHLGLLWQEWQVVNKTRLLFAQQYYLKQIANNLKQNKINFEELYKRTNKELKLGNTTLDKVSASLTALQDTISKINDNDLKQNNLKHELNGLLGVSPEIDLPLVSSINLPKIDVPKTIDKIDISKIIANRPDLAALEAGYNAQDTKFRQAILLQFPALNIGFNKAKDTSDLHTNGFSLSINLPIFNRNQGNVAIEKASREYLHEEYQTRINQAVIDINKIISNYNILSTQLRNIEKSLKDMRLVARNAELALNQGNLSMLDHTNLKTSLLKKEIEKLDLEQAATEHLLTLHMLTGNGKANE